MNRVFAALEGLNSWRGATACAVPFARIGLGVLAALFVAASPALAAQPHDWGVAFQEAATDLMSQIAWFELYTRVILAVVLLFVLALLVWVMFRYSAKRNETPSTTSHNTLVEVVWTIVPVMILVAIAFPSFRLLYNQTTIPTPDMAVKATGGQWYWNYDYIDDGLDEIPTILSYMLSEEDRLARIEEHGLTEDEAPRLLAVDYPLVVPVGAVVHMLVSSLDVNHAVAMPSFGLKTDSVQGRTNQNWFKAEAPGVYYGQCSELCGRSHAFMPLEFRVLTQERFDEWAELAKQDMDQATEQLIAWQIEDRELAVADLAAR